MVVAADRAGVFAAHLPYHTWEPRPVAGSAGLVPESWHPAHEAWGATQWQTRFEEQARRTARDEDYQVWMALRVLGEAATRTQGGDFAAIRDFVGSDEFDLAAFKGQKLTFRDWDGQLRQPILLTAGTGRRLGLAAGRVPAPGQPARHARDRPARRRPARDREERWQRLAVLLASRRSSAGPALAEKIFVSNEKGNTVTRARRRRRTR